MAVYFQEPDGSRDWRSIVEGLVLAGADGITLNATGAYDRIRATIAGSRAEPDTDERAGIWLRVTVLTAVFDLLGDPALESPHDTAARSAAVKSFVAEALNLSGFDELTRETALSPDTACPARAVAAALPRFLRDAAPRHRLSDAALAAAFAARLRAASARVFARDPDFYAPLDAALDSNFTRGRTRDLAWARHANRVQDMYLREPVFSLDDSAETPLAATYHPLRCHWHEPIETGDDEDHFGRYMDLPQKYAAHVADLHETLNRWIAATPRKDTVRLVTGGPGSGKSSFSRAFASGIIARGSHRLLYIKLQALPPGDDLQDRIGRYLQQNDRDFPENPLDWPAADQPLLVIFDGLDELSHDEDRARDHTRRFIASVRALLSALNTTWPDARALVLGRDAAAAAALRELTLPLGSLIHVAPLTPLGADYLARPKTTHDPGGLAGLDERPAFWQRSARARRLPDDPVPEAVTDPRMGELNAEPLLLHLLIQTGYTDGRWQSAAENHNRIYHEIFSRIFERDRREEKAPSIGKQDFFALIECLGLAAWRGNGRNASEADFEAVKALHCTPAQRTAFTDRPETALAGIAVQFHTRPDLRDRGFEFTHKSFGEYLAARALIRAGLNAAEDLTEGRRPRRPEEVALDWTRLIGAADLSEDIVRFLRAEAALMPPERAVTALRPLAELVAWVLENGMPAHHAGDAGTSYRDIETAQRCAEGALLATVDALTRQARLALGPDDPLRWPVNFGLYHAADPNGVAKIFHRLHIPHGSPLQASLGCMDLSHAILTNTTLTRPDETAPLPTRTNALWSNLTGTFPTLFTNPLAGVLNIGMQILVSGSAALAHRLARVSGPVFDGAQMDGINLRSSHLMLGSFVDARMTKADLSDCVLSGANLSNARLQGARFGNGTAIGCSFVGTRLDGCDFRTTNLDSSNLTGASLRDADLRKARSVKPGMLAQAFGVRSGGGKTKLPEGIDPPDHWYTARPQTIDTREASDLYEAAYQDWLKTLTVPD